MSGWMHRGLRELVFLLAGLAALLLLAAAGLWWWSGSEGSLAWMLRQVARSQPLDAQGVHGSLREGLHVERLHWQEGGIDVEASDVRLEWQPLALARRQLRVDRLEAAQVRVEDRRPAAPSQPPESLEVPLRIAADQVKIGRLDWVSAKNTVTVANLAGAYSFDGARHRVQLEDLRWAGGSYRGQATLGARQPLPLEANVEGRFEAAVPGGAASLPLQFNANFQGPITDLKVAAFLNAVTAASSSPRGTVTASVPATATATAQVMPWAAQPIAQAQADFRGLDLGALWPGRLPHTSLTGAASVQPGATGTWTIAADASNALAGPWDRGRLPIDRLSAQGEWQEAGQGLVRSLRAELGRGELQAHGAWRGADGWTVEGLLKQVDPSALYSAMAALPVSGSADLKGAGSAIDFNVDLKAAVNAKAAPRRRGRSELASTVQALELRRGTARGRWAEGRLTLPAFDVRTADASLHGSLNLQPDAGAGSGRVSLDAPGLQGRAEGELAAARGRGNARLDLADAAQATRWLRRLPGLARLLPDVELAGRGQAQVSWQGGWRDPALQARLEAPMLQVQETAQARAAESSSAPWIVRDAVANVEGRLRDASLQLRGRAEQGRRLVRLELAGRGGLRSRGPDVWQAQVASLNVSATDPQLGPGSWTLALQKPFDLRSASGSFDAGAGQALLSAPRAAGAAGAATPAVLSWDPVRWRTGELRTAGRLTGLPLAWLELIGGPQLAGSAVGGDMVFDGQWDASLGATARLRATLARNRGDLTLMAETVQGASASVRAGVRDARLTLTSEGDAVTLALKWDSERAGTADGRIATRLLRGSAGWSWPADAPLDGAVRAQLPRIGVWSLLAPPGWRLRGSLAADVHVAGTRAEPRLAGTLAADDLALRSVVDGVELQGGRLRARLDGQRLVVDEFLLYGAGGASGGGSVLASGEGSWTGAGPQARVAAQLTRLRASIRSDRQLIVSGRVAANVSPGGTELAGNLKVDQARIVLPDETAPHLGSDVVVRGAEGPVTKTEARTTEQAQAKGGRLLKMAVDVDLGNDFRVRGHGIDTRLGGTLALSGESLAAPRLNGTIRAEGGEYQAYGQRLNIERGVLRFTGPIDNPSLDVLAIRPYLTQRVGVQVTGTPLTPYVQLYSEPDMAEADKLSWLVLGRASPTGGAEAALLQRAALALLSGRSGNGKRGVVASMGLDELSFRRDGPEGPAVTLGKRFGRNVYAAYERSLSGAMGTLQVFYDLTRRLKVRAEAGERTAVDLIYTLTFN